MVFSLSALSWRRIRGLWNLHDGRDWLRGKLDVVLMVKTVLSKSLTQFSVDRWGCIPSLLFDLRPNYGGGNEDTVDLLQKVPCMHYCTQYPKPVAGHHRPMPLPEIPDHSLASLGRSLVGSLLFPPGSWCAQGSVCALWSPVSPVPCKFWWLYDGVNGNLLHEILCHTPSMIGNNKKTGDVTQISRCLEPGKIGRWSKVSLLLHLAMVR